MGQSHNSELKKMLVEEEKTGGIGGNQKEGGAIFICHCWRKKCDCS